MNNLDQTYSTDWNKNWIMTNYYENEIPNWMIFKTFNNKRL